MNIGADNQPDIYLPNLKHEVFCVRAMSIQYTECTEFFNEKN